MKNPNKEKLSKIYEDSSRLARWMALYEAINCCAEKAEQRNIPFSKVNLKPLDIKEYINSTEDIILKKLLKCDYNIDVYYEEVSPVKEEYSF